jgi:DNA-binding MarR family transcriptional regulator
MAVAGCGMQESPSRETAGAPIDRPRPAEISLGILEHYIGFHLRLAQNASFKAFKRLTGESDLRPGWFAVMMLIHANPGITPMALSRASGRDKSTLTPVLRDLESRAYVERCPVPHDKRSHALVLTATGEEMLAKLAEHAAEHDRRIDEIVGCPRKAELLAVLRRIASQLD